MKDFSFHVNTTRELVEKCNSLRLSNKQNWLWIVFSFGSFDRKIIVKQFNTWVQILKVSDRHINYSCGLMDQKVMAYKENLTKDIKVLIENEGLC